MSKDEIKLAYFLSGLQLDMFRHNVLHKDEIKCTLLDWLEISFPMMEGTKESARRKPDIKDYWQAEEGYALFEDEYLRLKDVLSILSSFKNKSVWCLTRDEDFQIGVFFMIHIEDQCFSLEVSLGDRPARERIEQ